jgi:YHS domain-containing protein
VKVKKWTNLTWTEKSLYKDMIQWLILKQGKVLRKKDLTSIYEGVTYYFFLRRKSAFAKSPLSYEPQYGVVFCHG